MDMERIMSSSSLGLSKHCDRICSAGLSPLETDTGPTQVQKQKKEFHREKAVEKMD
jgi:Asp/Glu/hydantoin racemase